MLMLIVVAIYMIIFASTISFVFGFDGDVVFAVLMFIDFVYVVFGLCVSYLLCF